MKEYKTNEELIDYLISKNIIINNKFDAINKLEKYTYYGVINGYKTNFKDNEGNYIPNVSFDEIFALYEFDKNIKYIFLKYILEIEIIVKSLIANQISKQYGLIDYLNLTNLDDNINKDIKENLISKINNEIKHNYQTHSAITHYLDNYGFVPPFVLIKVLSFGVTSSYYGLLKQSDRQEVAKHFKISDKTLKQVLKNLTSIRNICAHSDRLFCFRDKYTLSFKLIDKKYKSKDNTTNLYMIIKILKYMLNDDLYNEFITRFNNEINILKSKLNSIDINDILKIMGYPNE